MTTSETKYRNLSLSDYLLLATIGVVIVWALYAVETFFGVDFKGRKIAKDEGLVPLWLAIAATPAIYGAAWIYHRREKAFLSRSVPVTGSVISVSRIEMKGLRDITYSYHFGPIGSITYRSKRSVSASLIQDLEPGDDVAILVDQSNPKSSRLDGE